MNQNTVRILARASYYVHPQEVGRLSEQAITDEIWMPAVVLSVKYSEYGLSHVAEALEHFALKDDVYSDDFNATVVLQSVRGLDTSAIAERLKKGNTIRSVYARDVASNDFLPSGPYFIQGKTIHQAWKLYEDDLDAFVIPIIPDDVYKPENFSVLQAVSTEGSFRSIAVPSRLYSELTTDKPLAGVRVSIKDNYDLKGIRTTMMNRAYNELYPPRESTADYIRKLIDLGAIIVGKTKMSAFASAEEPTDQWIDYHCPFNPRGDKYQTPSCSSTGAGASLAGYSWLDHSIGTDSADLLNLF
ncbi:MAG: hypothetical protein M1821_004740 [Bathelium mastoideum]|nr:MAG: hypothetical protein M1821_004740 [Bathelium mastoideum]